MKSKLSYQQARQMCTSRGLANTGTVSLLRKRLADWEKKKREDSKPPRHPFQEARAEAIVYESFHPTATDVVKQGKEALMAELRAGEFTTSHVDEEPLFIANHKGHTLFERMEGLQNEVKTLGSKVQGLEGNAAKVDAELRDVRLELNDKVELLRSGRDRVGNAVRIRYLLNTTKFIGDGLLPSKQYDLVKHGDEEAHMADPITDAKMFRDGVCHHDSAFTQVYGLSWSQVLVYESDVQTLLVLKRRLENPSAIVRSPVPAGIEAAFQAFVIALQDTGCPLGYLSHSKHPATIAHKAFWNEVSKEELSRR